jgi:hypothetical protein
MIVGSGRIERKSVVGFLDIGNRGLNLLVDHLEHFCKDQILGAEGSPAFR